MLYVSRFQYNEGGDTKIGIYDTDDDKEEFVDAVELGDAIVYNGLKIEGCSIKSIDKWERRLYNIRPHQVLSEVTTLQTKMRMLSHVEVTTWNDMITSIRWDRDKIAGKPVTVRLSDFASVVGDCVLWGNLGSEHSVTLVFDDDIMLWKNSFAKETFNVSIIFEGGLGVKFDIREMTNEQQVHLIYEAAGSRGDISDSIIDHPERKELMRKIYDTMFPDGEDFV